MTRKVNANKIKEIREEMRFTQKEFAYRVWVKYKTYWQWENKWVQPKFNNLMNIIDLHNEGYAKGNFTIKPIKQMVLDDMYI